MPADLPLVVSGRAVNLLAKPIDDVQAAADFNSVMGKMRALGVLPTAGRSRARNRPPKRLRRSSRASSGAARVQSAPLASLIRRPLARRIVGHTLGLIAAALIAWLVMRAYRQPELLLDLANMRLC